MKAKFTKDGRVSVKLDDQVWQALEQAFRMELSLVKVMPIATWCLMEECLEKIETRSSSSIKFKRSEFFTVFDQSIFQHIDEATTILAWNVFEPLQREVASRAAYPLS